MKLKKEIVMIQILIVGYDAIFECQLVTLAKSINCKIIIFRASSIEEVHKIANEKLIDIFILNVSSNDLTVMGLIEKIKILEKYPLATIIITNELISKDDNSNKELNNYSVYINHIKKALKRLVNDSVKNESRKIIISSRKATYLFEKSDIIFIERKNRKINIITKDREPIVLSISLTYILDLLPDNFVLCHQGYIVNKTLIKKIDHKRNLLYIKGIDFGIPISRTLNKETLLNI